VKPAADKELARHSRPTILDKVDLTLKLDKKKYEEELKKLTVHMRELEFEIYKARVPVVVTYEGWDAAGKGGNIKRITSQLDPRGYEVVPIAAPSVEEKAHQFLWRFWNQIPKAGHITVFDRSWYGRVMVERVEGFCHEDEWRRAFQEIKEFEGNLAEFGTVIAKFWIHISKQEQLKRFEERKTSEYKNYKLTDEDWRNRDKWDRYEEAVLDMLENTSTTYAPWTIVEGEDKYWARIRTLRVLSEAIERRLG
jgi:polyphosphate kinase 2 (PPK2 family)